MRIGLTGGIASGKMRFEQEFRRLGYAIFDLDKVDFSLRTGDVICDQNSDIFKYESIADLTKKLSLEIIAKLKENLPKVYDPNGKFNRRAFLEYLNDEKVGKQNYDTYNRIIDPPGKIIYCRWCDLVRCPSVLSSALLLERGYLYLMGEIYILQITEEQQLKNLIKRETERGNDISVDEAMKAIRRQLSFEEKVKIATSCLEPNNVHIIRSNSNLEQIHAGGEI